MTIPATPASMESSKLSPESPIPRNSNKKSMTRFFFDRIAQTLFFFPPHDAAVARIVLDRFCLRLGL